MEAGLQEDRREVLHNYCSKLLELAATDDLAGFKYEVEERGSDVNEVGLWYGRSFGSKKMGFEERTPIMISSMCGSTEVLKFIIASGKVDVNRACGSDSATALHCAAAGGSWSSVEVVQLLIEASADNNVVDVNGKKPGDLIASCVKSSNNSKRRTMEMLLNGISLMASDEEEEERWMSEKKEYPIDISLPDINNGMYGSDEFRMYSFKVKPCSRAYSHDWTECPFVHPGENARRRDPLKYYYTCVPCPEFKKGSCGKGDDCEYAHGVFESWLHPAQYRTRLCKDETSCARKVCFFAHKPEDLRPLYASTGSAMPSPKSVLVNSLNMTSALSPLSLGSSSMVLPNNSTPPMSPSITCSSPMWQHKVNLTPPALQLSGSRLKTALSARDVDLDMELLELENIHTQKRQQLIEEMTNLSSPYNRIGDMKPTNLDDVFGTQFQGLSPKYNTTSSSSQLQSPLRPNMNHLRASYPSNISSSPTRKPSAYGSESSAAMAAAVMNSRTAAFTKQSQSFIDRSSASGYRPGFSGFSISPRLMQSKLPDWSSPDGQLNWGFNGEDMNKLRKSASFGYRNGNVTASSAAMPNEPDVSWHTSMVKDVPSGGSTELYSSEYRQGVVQEAAMRHWLDQMYIEQEQIVA